MEIELNIQQQEILREVSRLLRFSFFFYKLLVVNYIAVIIQFAKNLQDCKLPYEGDIYLLRWLIGMSFNIFHDILC